MNNACTMVSATPRNTLLRGTWVNKFSFTNKNCDLLLSPKIVRWTAKTNQLSEQFKNVDVDEYKRIKEEKKQFQQQISSLKSDNQRMRTQAESLKSELSKTQGELVGLKVMLSLLSSIQVFC